MSLRWKLLLSGVLLTAIPLLLIYGALWRQDRQSADAVSAGTTDLQERDLVQLAQTIYASCGAYNQMLQRDVDTGLSIAAAMLQRESVVPQTSKRAWKAVNQFTHDSTDIEIPKWNLGRSPLDPNDDPAVPSPVVDDVQKMTGATVTIFERMNPDGEMLRIATNVLNQSGKRAIGTFIPLKGANGEPNPVLAAVLAGSIYKGRAFVVDQWYATAYQAVKAADGSVIGMLYAGIPEQTALSKIRAAMAVMKIGKSGFVSVISHGSPIIGSGTVQPFHTQAARLKPGQILTASYQDPTGRLVEARSMYYAPWDWVVTLNAYQDEIFETRDRLANILHKGEETLAIFAAVTLLLAVVIWYALSRNVTAKLGKVVERLQPLAAWINGASRHLEKTSGALLSGSGDQEQAALAAENSLALINQAIEKAAGQAAEVTRLANAAQAAADIGGEDIRKMGAAMNDIQKANSEVAGILRTMEEIAFQTNILALNASIEAARAGEAGLGFAVVADEVRNLSKRSAQAAKDTAARIQASTESSARAGETTEVVAAHFQSITARTRDLNQCLVRLAETSEQQKREVLTINSAMAAVRRVTSSNADQATRTAQDARKLSKQTDAITGLVTELKTQVSRAKKKTAKPRPQPGSSKRPAPEPSRLLHLPPAATGADYTRTQRRKVSRSR